MNCGVVEFPARAAVIGGAGVWADLCFRRPDIRYIKQSVRITEEKFVFQPPTTEWEILLNACQNRDVYTAVGSYGNKL